MTDLKNKAWVVTADMGYGHQRAAYPFRDIACERIITANSDTVVAGKEKKMWRQFQNAYETVSRLGKIPLVGNALWHIYDRLQSISPIYPFRDLSKPSFGSLRLSRLLKKGFANGVPDYTKKHDIPFLTTFFAIALAAEKQGVKDVSCVVTDSDINRIWVSNKPKDSKITYFVPTHRAYKRLLLYGIPEKQVFVTGFPLPPENTESVRDDLATRINVLDPKKVFTAKYKHMLDTELGPLGTTKRPLTIVFAIGGAGAQAELVKDILSSLKPALLDGRMKLHLVAGTRLELNRLFTANLQDVGLADQLGHSIHILSALSKTEYFAHFNAIISHADILWTKPSELSFYCALGLPIVMTKPLGSHEVCNADWLAKMGAGIPQEDPKAALDWIEEWVENGTLAQAAFNGFYNAPRHGTDNIKQLLFATDRQTTKLRN